MKVTRLLMGMPITVEVVDAGVTVVALESVFTYFQQIDATFSTYKSDSEISRINAGLLSPAQASGEVQTVLQLCKETKAATAGYFDIEHQGSLDPSGLVKGWSILQAAKLLRQQQLQHFYIEAGGDIQVAGRNGQQKAWTVGIRHPFLRDKIVKVLELRGDVGVATSGTYERGQHIYNPFTGKSVATDIVSFTVVGPNVYEADRFATAAFAMGKLGLNFIATVPGLAAYQIDQQGQATQTSNFSKYVKPL